MAVCYSNGKKAIDDIEFGLKYDVALIDLSLPGVDGLEVMNISKKVNPDIPIISISGYSRFKPKLADVAFLRGGSLEKLIEYMDSLTK